MQLRWYGLPATTEKDFYRIAHREDRSCHHTTTFRNGVVPENTHTSPTEGIFYKTLNPSRSYNKLDSFLKYFGLREPIPLPGNSFREDVWMRDKR